MLKDIADARLEAVFLANCNRIVGAGDGFGVATETRQRKNTRHARPDDRELVTAL